MRKGLCRNWDEGKFADGDPSPPLTDKNAATPLVLYVFNRVPCYELRISTIRV